MKLTNAISLDPKMFFFFPFLQFSDVLAILTVHSQYLGPLAARICLAQ